MGRAQALIWTFASACTANDKPVVDAARDAPADANGGPCGVDYLFSGRYIDWDATDSLPCPIAAATWIVDGDPGRYGPTDANGAFAVCLNSAQPNLDLRPPTLPVACSNGTYQIPGIAISVRAVVDAGGGFVARSMTMQRATAFYGTFGSTFDSSRADLLVHVNGAARTVTISSTHEATQAFDGSTWAPGGAGTDVFFPNIDLSGGNATDVTVSGGAIGTGSVPLLAGYITYLAVIAN